MTAKKWTILGVGILLIGAAVGGWLAFRQQFYLFMMYHGRGNWASTRMASLPDVDLPMLEKHLESEKWFVRCSVVRTLRKMDDKERILPILEKQLPREKHSSCQLELAAALMKFNEYDKAKEVLEGLVNDPEVGEPARNLLENLKKISPPAGG